MVDAAAHPLVSVDSMPRKQVLHIVEKLSKVGRRALCSISIGSPVPLPYELAVNISTHNMLYFVKCFQNAAIV